VQATVRGWRLGISAALLVTTGVAVGLFSANHQRAVRETFRSQGVAFAVAFVVAAEEWLAVGDTDAIERAARLMLLGSVLYVQVVSGGSLQVDARRESLAETELARVSTSRVPQATYARVGPGAPALDVVVPLVVGGPGQVRVGFDTGSIVADVRTGVLVAAGSGIAFNLVAIGLLFVATRRRTPSPAKDEVGVARIGEIVIEESQKRVTLAGVAVALPPKQYALLSLLASEPGRVFSDREILAAVWPDSRYANSKDVKQHVYLLRRRLGKVRPGAEGTIVTVPGFGYRLESGVEDR
jgi:DNA-binding winged helix-turn-helix (wHTH) protein